ANSRTSARYRSCSSVRLKSTSPSRSVRRAGERERAEAVGQLTGALEVADAPAEVPRGARARPAEERLGEPHELLPEGGLRIRPLDPSRRLVDLPGQAAPVEKLYLHARGPHARGERCQRRILHPLHPPGERTNASVRERRLTEGLDPADAPGPEAEPRRER